MVEREVVNVNRGVGKSRDKGKGKVGFKLDVVVEVKVGFKGKVVVEIKEGARLEFKVLVKGILDFNYRIENKFVRFIRKDKFSSDNWFWVGEDFGINFWFWKGEEFSNNFVVKCENKFSISI